jgi:hypothetical protein
VNRFTFFNVAMIAFVISGLVRAEDRSELLAKQKAAA